MNYKKILCGVMATVFMAGLASCGKSTALDPAKTFRVAMRTPIRKLDPQAGNDSFTSLFLGAMADSLVEEINGELVPMGAESYTISPDGLLYTFNLRDGVKWSDGEALTADTWVYSFQQLLVREVATNYATLLNPIKNAIAIQNGDLPVTDLGVRAVDADTFEIELVVPTGYFLGTLSTVTFKPVRKSFVDAHGETYGTTSKKTPQGIGAYVIDKFDGEGRSVLKKNPNYWNASNIKVDFIEVTIVAEEATAMQLFDSGKIDYLELTSKENSDHYKDQPVLHTMSDGGVYLFEYGLDKAKYAGTRTAEQRTNLHKMISSPNFKKMISYSIDRKQYTSGVMGNGAVAAKTLNHPEIDLLGTDKGVPYVETYLFGTEAQPGALPADFYVEEEDNPVKARAARDALLLEMGLQLGQVNLLPKVNVMFSDSGFYKDLFAYLQGAVEEVTGYQIQSDQVTWAVRNDRQKNQQFEMGLWGWGPDYNDPLTFLYGYDMRGNGGKAWMFADENGNMPTTLEYEDLNEAGKIFTDALVAAQLVFTADEKGALYAQAEALFLDPSITPITPLVYAGGAYILNTRIHGFEKRFTGTALNVYNISIVPTAVS